MNYDPNLTNSGRMATQTVELIFQQWEYTATYTTTVGGNCTGLSVIESAVDNIAEELGEDGEMIMTRPNGDTLGVEMWDEDLKDLLVSARITAITQEVEEAPESSANTRGSDNGAPDSDAVGRVIAIVCTPWLAIFNLN